MRALAFAVLVLGACDTSSPMPVVPPDAYQPIDAPTHAGAGPGGGTLDELRFAVVGDTRPANLDDTAGYPTAVVRQIWTDVAGEHTQFAVTTGDYMFASTTGEEVGPQIDAYLGARAAYPGIVYPALGNHECNGYTKSNCGFGATDGLPPNYLQFLDRMVKPIGETKPFFAERFAATDGSWTAKFVFVAANAWSVEQAHWLELVLSEPTTYTFVVRHEPHEAETAPGVGPSQEIIAKHPLTLQITGHSHTYRHVPAWREIVVGNGGAPLTSATNYGYAIISRNPDGTLDISARDYQTLEAIDQFSVTRDGVAP